MRGGDEGMTGRGDMMTAAMFQANYKVGHER